MPHAPEHVCAALPKLCVGLHVVYCQVHQAWSHTVTLYALAGDEPHVLTELMGELGPFDEPEAIIEALRSALAAMPAAGDGVPQLG